MEIALEEAAAAPEETEATSVPAVALVDAEASPELVDKAVPEPWTEAAAPLEATAAPVEAEVVPEARRSDSGEESDSVPRSDTPPLALDDEHGAIQVGQVGHQEMSIEVGVQFAGPLWCVEFLLCSPCRGRYFPESSGGCALSLIDSLVADLGKLPAGPRC